MRAAALSGSTFSGKFIDNLMKLGALRALQTV
jgi:hypothetical protein